VHHNDAVGIAVNGGSNAIIDNNEIAHNNDDQTELPIYSAGAKFLATKNLTVTNNLVHNNHGLGLWTYKDNIDTRYEGNVIEYNWLGGIGHDQSYAVTITGNEFRNNGFMASAAPDGQDLYYGAAQITGPNATVTNNYLSDNWNGIVVIGYHLDDNVGLYGPLTAVNAIVTDNEIIDSGNTGLVTNGTTTVFSTATFDRNDYQYADTAARHWVWNAGGGADWDTWRNNYRQDLNGTLLPL